MKIFFRLSLFSGIATCILAAPMSKPEDLPQAHKKEAHVFSIKDDAFTINDKPIQIISGEIHYPRVPREYWRDRIQRAKAMGCNTICTYLFWNIHEPDQGQWDFSGNKDFVAFCKIAQEENMWVIVRPGPYVCAEWEWGGFPGWLANTKGQGKPVVIRSQDPRYFEPAKNYLCKVSALLKPLQVGNGGSIIMCQVENEYGSYDGKDPVYLRAHKDIMEQAGLTKLLMFTSDGPADHMIQNGTLPDIPSAMNFGGDAQGAFNSFHKYRPNAPLMNGEFWVGWFDHWGKHHNLGNTGSFNNDLKWMLENRVSPNFFMVHGGTSFGFMNGANWNGKYEADVTSYDYGAPISEDGTLTERFWVFRKTIGDYLQTELPEPPADLPKITIPPISFDKIPAISLNQNLPNPIKSRTPQKMEQLGQSLGYIMYSTLADFKKGENTLKLPDMQDRAIIILQGKRIGVLDRRHKQDTLKFNIANAGRYQLDIFVENMGRINFSAAMRDESKGINTALLGGKELLNWNIYSFPFTSFNVTGSSKNKPNTNYPTAYTSTFELNKLGDSYLDMQNGWKKGIVFVNGINLGRYWNIGAQQTLFCPAPFLKAGENTIQILELDGGFGSVSGVLKPVWKTNPESLASKNRQEGETLNLATCKPIHEASFAAGEARQDVKFAQPVSCRYIALVAQNAHDGQDIASVAELLFKDATGKVIPQEQYSIAYADSEESIAEASTAEHVMDNQPTTIWHTQYTGGNTPFPHYLVIDLGNTTTVSGFNYIPRQDKENGRIKDYAIYCSSQPFPGLKQK